MIIRAIKGMFTRKSAADPAPVVKDETAQIREKVRRLLIREPSIWEQQVKQPQDFPHMREQMDLSKKKEEKEKEDARLKAEADEEQARQRSDRRGGSAGEGSGGGPVPRPPYAVLGRRTSRGYRM